MTRLNSQNDRLEDLDNITWSVSALKSMGTCGHQWEIKYRQKLIQPMPTPPLAFGSAVHKAIERLHKENDKWNPADWQEMWSDVWFEYSQQVNWQGYRKTQFDKLGPEMISNYIKLHRSADVLEIETKFPDTDNDFRVGEFAIKGVIDQVRRLPNGRLLVVDLKTSKKEPEELLLRADPQFTLYYECIKQKYKEEPLIAWLHLRTGQLLYTKRNKDDVDIVYDMLKEAQSKVEQKLFSRNVGYHCSFCPFIQECLGPIGAKDA